MYRCESDDDVPTLMAPTAAPVPTPILAVPRASSVPHDILEYATAFAQAEELAQAAAHAHAGRYATPPPPPPAKSVTAPIPRAPSHALRPVGPQANAVMTRQRPRHGRERATPWRSIALVAFVGVVATLFATAAANQLEDSPRVNAPRRTAPAAVLPAQTPAPTATITSPTS